MYGFYGISDSWLLLALLGVMVLGFIAQTGVASAFKKYSKVKAASGARAVDVANSLLRKNGSDVAVTKVGGSLTDHYNPQTRTVGLSETVYSSDSVAAMAIAAHEIGHVIQHKEQYLPIRIRNAVLPAANLGSQAAPFIVLLGVMIGSFDLAIVGVVLFGAMLAFQLITLPVEFNASSRAIRMLTDSGFLAYEEAPAAKKVLRAAALTYVVAALASALTLIRLLLMANRTRRD